MERGGPELPAAAVPQIETDDQTALVSKPKNKGGNSNLASAGFNIINSIIGSGIIGLPYSMKEAGFPLGILLLFGVAYITDYSIILLIKGGNLSSTNTYQELVRKTYGLIGYLILSTLQFLYPFIVGPDNILTDRHFIILLTTIIFTLPLSLYRDIAKLGKVSLISLILTVVILVIVMVRTVTLGLQVPKSENAWIFAKSNAVQAIGVMSFAFICHHNSFLIYGSLEEPTLNNWSRITHVSVSLAVVISVLFAACGYMTFTGYTEGDIFENYCRDDNLATFGRFCYGVTVILTFPLECFVTREVIANVFFHGNLSTVFHIVVTVIIIAVATGVSLVYDCLGIVLELNGVLSATPLVFIIPTACYLRLSKERWNHSDNLISCLILVIGVLVMTVGFVLTLLHPQECSHGKEMFYCFSSNVSFHNSTLPP
ncbi:putative sodium-coupled neutral amino acid transporter 11 isoform X2 [Oxyura jamaicensis]|uniref:putative sodium-coupled neutral amino acid transporter 11 isoform X2 n=1 Tax=Oxyura jamaicensis TaxID=8884 RepID=UPI0015A5243A|nr:putative sodium-coupled neutral amino acid transporter 11 isoform X2 [Oxyura jamaicensis]